MKSSSALLLAVLVSLAGPTAAQPDRPSASKSKARPITSPMVFYLAKGDADACGQGCGEWIAAEGQVDAGATERLRALLTRVGKRKLPIFFHSPGGIGTTAIAMGRLLRKREMTAGVSQTMPVDCIGVSEQGCRALKQSGQVLASELRNVAGCSSACVLALIGAKVRQVPPGARLGVHAARLELRWSDGRRVDYSDGRVASFQKARMVELNGQFRRYVQEMKIDPGLHDLAIKVPHENIRYLSRDEIVGFGIDTREFREGRWIAAELLPQQLWAMKYFVEAKGEDRKELRTSVIRLECVGARYVKASYFRNLGTLESEPRRKIKLAMGDRGSLLSGPSAVFKMEPIESGAWFNLWSTVEPLEFFEAAAARPTAEIVESEPTSTVPRVTILSTVGLSQALMKLRERCGGGQECPQAGSAVGSSASPLGTGGMPNSWTEGALLPMAGTTSPNWDAASSNCLAPTPAR